MPIIFCYILFSLETDKKAVTWNCMKEDKILKIPFFNFFFKHMCVCADYSLPVTMTPILSRRPVISYQGLLS